MVFGSGHLAWHLCAAALVLGAGGVLYQTSYPTFFARLVRRDRYVEANSLLSTTRSGSFIAGPAIGGALIQAVTAPVAMLVDAVSFLVSAVAIASVRVDERGPPTPARWRRTATGSCAGPGRVSSSSRGTPTCGCRWPARRPLNFFSFVVAAVLIVFANRSLGLDAAQIGLAFGSGRWAAWSAPWPHRRLGRVIGTGRTIVVGAVLFSAPFAFLPFAGGGTAAKVASSRRPSS